MMQELTSYFDGEGRNFMKECVDRSVEWCARAGLRKIVIFTGTGEGPLYAATEALSKDAYSELQIIAVTPPVGRPYRVNPSDLNSPVVRAGISPAMRDELTALGITVLSAHLPFKEVHNGRERTSEWSRVLEAYGILGGGFALCVQALLMACDAGAVESGERVVVASADTAFVGIASRTESFLSPTEGMLVEHIICRPMRYRVSKSKHQMVDQMWGPTIVQQESSGIAARSLELGLAPAADTLRETAVASEQQGAAPAKRKRSKASTTK